MRDKFYIGVIWVLAICAAALFARLHHMQKQIDKAPKVQTEFSKSGYTPPDVYGHGNLVGDTAGQGWYIYDKPNPDNKLYSVQKVCAFNVTPDRSWDIDFIYSNGAWFKLRTGTAERNNGTLEISPPSLKWKGFLQTQTAFPIRRPDLPYRLKILVSKLQYGVLSPLEYVQSLKETNPSCADIPAP